MYVNDYSSASLYDCQFSTCELHAKQEKTVSFAAIEEADGTQNYNWSSMTSLNVKYKTTE